MSRNATKHGLEAHYWLWLSLCLMMFIGASPAVFGEDDPAQPVQAEVSQPAFPDIPPEHWAADSVADVARLGIMKGYPDSTFGGEQPVTRYELAVALANLMRVLEAAHPAVTSEEGKAKAGAEAKSPAWAADSVNFLVWGGVFAPDSPIITDGAKPVTAEDLAQALASVASRITERQTPDPGPNEMP